MFKVEDWVRVHECVPTLYEVAKIIDIGMIDKDKYYEVDGCLTQEERLELWQPKESEWCWFKDNSSNAAVLAKFIDIDDDGEFEADIDGLHRPFINCEPFIGELPSFIKEK